MRPARRHSVIKMHLCQPFFRRLRRWKVWGGRVGVPHDHGAFREHLARLRPQSGLSPGLLSAQRALLENDRRAAERNAAEVSNG